MCIHFYSWNLLNAYNMPGTSLILQCILSHLYSSHQSCEITQLCPHFTFVETEAQRVNAPSPKLGTGSTKVSTYAVQHRAQCIFDKGSQRLNLSFKDLKSKQTEIIYFFPKGINPQILTEPLLCAPYCANTVGAVSLIQSLPSVQSLPSRSSQSVWGNKIYTEDTIRKQYIGLPWWYSG